MAKRLPVSRPARAGSTRKAPGETSGEAASWQSRIFLYLEGVDPRLLDKETLKFYQRISESVSETDTEIQGPIPLPVRALTESPGQPRQSGPGDPGRFHRRLIKILSPTAKTMALLEKLSASGTIALSIVMEEADEDGSHVVE